MFTRVFIEEYFGGILSFFFFLPVIIFRQTNCRKIYKNIVSDSESIEDTDYLGAEETRGRDIKQCKIKYTAAIVSKYFFCDNFYRKHRDMSMERKIQVSLAIFETKITMQDSLYNGSM